MLKIKAMSFGQMPDVETVVSPTVFPDKTTQVWKLPEEVLSYPSIRITWEFESPAEFMDLAQLLLLIRTDNPKAVVVLDIPFFPYARQDHVITNSTTFAKAAFVSLLSTLPVDHVYTLDVHSDKYLVGTPVTSMSPMEHIKNALSFIKAHYGEVSAFCFPDNGAWNRYRSMLPSTVWIVCDKDRDGLTGEVLGMKISGTVVPVHVVGNTWESENLLIIDDICDGGRTFIEVAKVLKDRYPQMSLHLYTTHGIYSKGTGVLVDAGFKSIHNRNGAIVPC